MKTAYLISDTRTKEEVEASFPVGAEVFVIGVAGGPYDLDRFLKDQLKGVSVVQRFPDTPNLNYYTNVKGHMLQPAILMRKA